MAKVVVSATLKDLVVQATVLAGKFAISIKDSTGVTLTQESDTPTATFDDVGAGDYTASVVLLDTTGGQVGDVQSATFTVTAPATITVQGPDVVSVQVS